MRNIIATMILLSLSLMQVKAQYTSNIDETINGFKQMFQKPKSSFTPGEDFPKLGYDLGVVPVSSTLREFYIDRFPDCDTLYYIKATKSRRDANDFYFMPITENETYIILYCSLNKKEFKAKDRHRWTYDFLLDTGVKDINSETFRKNWLYWKPRQVLKDRNPHRGSIDNLRDEDFSLKAVKEHIAREKKKDEMWLKAGIAFIIFSNLSGNKSSSNSEGSKTNWDMMNDAQKAVIHEHDNAR